MWDRVQAPLRYDFPVDRLLRQLKFGRRLPPGRVLGTLMAERLATGLGSMPDVIVPVPLHPARLRRRGFNQAHELARPLAARLHLELAPSLCRRRRATREQARLPTGQRRHNVRGAFEVIGCCEGAHVAIVDDVVTTGSTAAELTAALREAGATRVEVWSCARA